MRKRLAEVFLKEAKKDKKVVFLTGDLGFNAFEVLKKKLGKRFINAGVAEQNMATAAAGLAWAGFKPWIFSIAPFVSLKIIEELRNDICLSNANVKIIGSGGGFDYELAGPTHHALEDIGALMLLPNIKVYIPATVDDINQIIPLMSKEKGPRYIRLVRARKIAVFLDKFEPCRRVFEGKKVTVVVLGSMIDKAATVSLRFNKGLIDLWTIGAMPFQVSGKLEESIKRTKKIMVIEEHVSSGGLGSYVSSYIHQKNIKINNFVHFYVKGYVSKRTGDRDFYLKESGLNEEKIYKYIKGLI